MNFSSDVDHNTLNTRVDGNGTSNVFSLKENA